MAMITDAGKNSIGL